MVGVKGHAAAYDRLGKVCLTIKDDQFRFVRFGFFLFSMSDGRRGRRVYRPGGVTRVAENEGPCDFRVDVGGRHEQAAIFIAIHTL